MVLLREVAVAFYGVELAYALALGAWLLATAAGALLPDLTGVRLPAALPRLLLVTGLLVPASVIFVRGSRLLLAGIPGAYLAFGQQLVVLGLAVAPVGLLSGWLFRQAARRWVEDGGTLAGAYSVESAGGLVGGLVATFGLAWGVPNFVLASAAPAVALLALAGITRRPGRRRVAGLALAALAAAALAATGLALDRPTTRWTHPDLVETHDSPYGRLVVTARGRQLSVFQNDAFWFETEGVEAEAFVHVAALQVDPPGRVLVLGGGASGLVQEVLKHGPPSVDWVEVDAAISRVVVPRLPARLRVPLADRRVRAILGDPRRVLHDTGSYDLILVGVAEPASGEANRFYTREFFLEAARHLSPSGLLAFRLASAEHYWTPPAARRARSIRDAAAAAFSDVLVLPGDPNVFLAAPGRLTRDTAVLADRLAARGIAARLVGPAYLRYVYDPSRIAEVSTRMDAVRAPVNADGRPICYQYTAVIWLSQFYPRLAAIDWVGFTMAGPPSPAWVIGLLALGAGAVAFLRRRPTARVAAFVATAGFGGMVLETVLLLHYQLKNGVVFQNIGVLLTALMAGLAGGALAIDRAGARAADRAALGAGWGRGIAVATSAVAGATGWTVLARPAIGLPLALALLGGTGCGVSMAFGYAGLRFRGSLGATAGRLYAADLAGAAIGTLAATFFLIPIAGLAVAAFTVVGLALALLLLA